MYESTNAIRRVSDIVSEYRKFVHGSQTHHPSVIIFSTSLLTRPGDRHDRGRSPPVSQRDEGQIDLPVGRSAARHTISGESTTPKRTGKIENRTRFCLDRPSSSRVRQSRIQNEKRKKNALTCPDPNAGGESLNILNPPPLPGHISCTIPGSTKSSTNDRASIGGIRPFAPRKHFPKRPICAKMLQLSFYRTF